MTRCPSCGLRLRDPASGCGSHGAPATVESSELGSVRGQGEPFPEALALAQQASELLGTRGYRLGRVLGRGGFGLVFAAERLPDGLPVAVKVALKERPEAADSLQREAVALQVIGAPHVPALYAHESGDELSYVVMEYVAEHKLADLLVERAGPMPMERVAALADAILAAVAAIHAKGLAHCDLKPENVFITPSGRACILDLGQARFLQRQPFPGEISAGATDVGTAEYMSPEQCNGLPADRRADVYGLGALFYELLTGAPPFWGNTAEVREAQRSRRPPPLRSRIACSDALEQVLRRCLAKDPSQRFFDASELRRAWESAVKAAPRAASSAAVTYREPITAVNPSVRPGQTREMQTMGLLFFLSHAELGQVRAVISASGGQIAETDGTRYVAAFGHAVTDNPAHAAFVAGRRLCATKLAKSPCVHVASISVQSRPDGSRRISSPLFSKADRFPGAQHPAGVIVTRAAAEALPPLNLSPISGREDWLLAPLSTNAGDSTRLSNEDAVHVGRDELLRTLVESAQAAFARARPTIVTVLADAGLGKTLLFSVTADKLETLPGVEVVRLTAREGVLGASAQLSPILLRRLLVLPPEAPADGGRELLGRALGSGAEHVWAAAALSLGWIDATHAAVQRLAAAPGALRLAAVRALGEAIRHRCQQGPLAVAIDDVHLADDATLDALEFATLKESGAPLWVLALARPSFEAARPAWASRAAQAQRTRLEPLGRHQMEQLARHLLHPVEYVPPSALARLAERTQGVPRQMVELVRGLKREGLVRRLERGTGHSLATEELDRLPELLLVQWNVTRELDALSPQLAAHARLCAIFGTSFSAAEVEGVLAILERDGLPEDLQLDAGIGIQRLSHAGVLTQRSDEQFDFVHPLWRDTVSRQLPEAQRTQLHRAALEFYQTLPTPSEARLPRLALHAARCGEHQAAAAAYLSLAQSSLDAQSYLEAEAAFSRALEHISAADRERLAAATRGRGLMRFRLGRHEDALKDLRTAREQARALKDAELEAELLLDEATVLDWMRDLEQSAALVRAATFLPIRRSSLLEARLRMGMARIHHRQGEAEACVRVGNEAAIMAEALGDAGYETRVIALLMVGADCANLGRLDASEQVFEAVITSAEARADALHLAAAHGNRVCLWIARREVERLFLDLRRAMQLARESGLPFPEFVVTINLGEVCYMLGDLERAVEYTARAIELVRQLFGELSREMNRRDLLLGRIALYRDDLPATNAAVARIFARMEEARAAGISEVEFVDSDRFLLEMLELGARNASAVEWDAFEHRWQGVQASPDEEVEALESRARCAARNGLGEEARAQFQRALALSELKPNLLGERVKRELAQRYGA